MTWVFPEEPGALTGHARICGGESQQWLIYLTICVLFALRRGRSP